MRIVLWVVSMVGAVGAGCALDMYLRAAPPFEPVAEVSQIMKATVGPCSDVVFGAVEIDLDDKGTHERKPETDAQWDAVHNSAITLMETGNLLMMPGRARDRGVWMQQSRALIEAGALAARAAETKDAGALMTAGHLINLSCDGCHNRYMKLP
ncbi:MAG: hypothetical protein ABSA57_15720 [Candidatus Acidiferrales bacterium]|jgi:hypothetical protein